MTDTPRKRRTRTTRPSVKLADRIARSVIRVGGIGTIAAISTVFVFLAWVVWPLLRSERLSPPRTIGAIETGAAGFVKEETGADSRVLATGSDDALSVVWTYDDSGRFRVVAADSGEDLSELRP